MDELTLDGKTYISSKKAAKITGYAKDYIGQLCREGRVEARLVGRSWYVYEESLNEHRFNDKRKDPEVSLEKVEEIQEPVREEMVPLKTKDIEETSTQVVNDISDIASNEAVFNEPVYVQEDTEMIETIPEDEEGHLTNMQDAWKEWFHSGGDLKVPDEKVNNRFESTVEAPEVTEPAPQVVLHRIKEVAPPQVQVDAIQMAPVATERYEKPFIAEERVRSPRRKSTHATNKVAYAVILSVIVLAIVVTSIVTGVGEEILGKSIGGPPILDALSGETRVEK